MKIAIGCDHGGLEHKNAIKEHLEGRGFEVCDCGIYEQVSVDYPEIALKVAENVAGGESELGVRSKNINRSGSNSAGVLIPFNFLRFDYTRDIFNTLEENISAIANYYNTFFHTLRYFFYFFA